MRLFVVPLILLLLLTTSGCDVKDVRRLSEQWSATLDDVVENKKLIEALITTIAAQRASARSAEARYDADALCGMYLDLRAKHAGWLAASRAAIRMADPSLADIYAADANAAAGALIAAASGVTNPRTRGVRRVSGSRDPTVAPRAPARALKLPADTQLKLVDLIEEHVGLWKEIK